ncbi:MAG: enoyl-CoA hydratase/isomerase family protein [Pseudomonadota bacterium]
MRIERYGRLMVWVFDRPEQSNGIDAETMAAMEGALGVLEASEAVSCLLVRGEGGVFSAGLDAELLETCFADRARFAAAAQRLARVNARLEAVPQITIACIEGICRLGGLELALACDLVVAGDGAEISDGHLGFDAMPGGGGTCRLPVRLGYGGALRFLLTSPVLNAAEARGLGLVDVDASGGDAAAEARALADLVTARDPGLMRDVKASLRAAAPAATNQTYLQAFRRSVIDRLVPE